MRTRTEDIGNRRVVKLLGRRIAGTYGRAKSTHTNNTANKGTRRVAGSLS